MAVTAAITVSSATGTAPCTIVGTCTVTNGNSTACNVTGIQTFAEVSGQTAQSVAAQIDAPGLGPGAVVAVAGSNGTLALNFRCMFFAPFSGEGTANPTSVIFAIGANVNTSATGSDAYVGATTTTVTISAPTSH